MKKRPPGMEGSCEYSEQAVAGSQKKGSPPDWGLGEVVTIPRRRNLPNYATFHKASDLI